MGLFRKKKEKQLYPSQERVAGQIAARLLAVQRLSALWLNAKASKISRVKLIFIIGALGLGFGFWCLWLIVGVLL